MTGETIRYTHIDSSVGRVLVAASTRGLCYLGLEAKMPLDAERVRDQYFPGAVFMHDDMLAYYGKDIAIWLSGDEWSLPALDLRGTPFQQAVWKALKSIPRGEVRTYSDIARAIGKPDAVRAVANACGSNPVSLLVPCHRVVRTGGGLGGYAWGIDLKEELLAREKLKVAA